MKCPYCSADNESKVVDSRSSREGYAVRRRRECDGCGKRFTTYEYIEKANIIVVKRDRRREEFDIAKLRNGVNIACTKRPVSIDEIQTLIENVVRKTEALGLTEIESSEIGNIVMDELYLLDQIAYIRFASVYRDFKTVEEFVKQITTLVQ